MIRKLEDMLKQCSYRRRPIIYGLVRAGEVMTICGATEIEKSILALDLSASVAAGEKWTDFDTEKSLVLIISKDTSEFEFCDRVKSLGGLGEDVVASIYFMNETETPRRMSASEISSYIIRKIKSFGVEFGLIVMDSIDAFYPIGFDDASNEAQGSFCSHLDCIAHETDAALVLTKHSTFKKSGSMVKSVHSGPGAAALSRAFDSNVTLMRHESGGILVECSVRSFPPVNPFVVKRDGSGRFKRV